MSKDSEGGSALAPDQRARWPASFRSPPPSSFVFIPVAVAAVLRLPQMFMRGFPTLGVFGE